MKKGRDSTTKASVKKYGEKLAAVFVAIQAGLLMFPDQLGWEAGSIASAAGVGGRQHAYIIAVLIRNLKDYAAADLPYLLDPDPAEHC